MPLYKFICLTCNNEHDSIEKIDTNFNYCPLCGMISKRKFSAEGQSFKFRGRNWNKYGYEGESNAPKNKPGGL